MTSVGSVWTTHVDSLSWPTLADEIRRMKLKGWCQSENKQCTNMFNCNSILFYLFTFWEFKKKWFNLIVDLFLGFCFTPSLLGRRMGSNINYFSKGWDEIQNTCKTTLHFFILDYDFISPTFSKQISLNPGPSQLASLSSAQALPPFFSRFLSGCSKTLNIVIVELCLKRIPNKS